MNHSPSFGCDTPLDLRIKSRLISATFSLININSSDRRKAAAQQSAEAQSRLYSGVFTPARKSVDVRQVRAAALTKLEAIEAKHSFVPAVCRAACVVNGCSAVVCSRCVM